MWRITIGLAFALLLVGAYAYQLNGHIQDLKDRLDKAETAVRTHERIRDADTSRGDVDADTRWLCDFAGKRGGCP